MQRVLGLLFGQPQRSFFTSELIALAGGGSGAVQRELRQLEEGGLVTPSRVGNRKHCQAWWWRTGWTDPPMSEYLHVEKPFLDQLAALGLTMIDQGKASFPPMRRRACAAISANGCCHRCFARRCAINVTVNSTPCLSERQLDDPTIEPALVTQARRETRRWNAVRWRISANRTQGTRRTG